MAKPGRRNVATGGTAGPRSTAPRSRSLPSVLFSTAVLVATTVIAADTLDPNALKRQQFPITFKLSGPAPNLGVRHGSVVAGARWGHGNTIQAAAWLVKLR